MGFTDWLVTAVKTALVLAIVAAVAVAVLFFANQHVRAQRKVKAQEKAAAKQQRQSTQSSAPKPAAPAPTAASPSRAFPVTIVQHAARHTTTTLEENRRQSHTTPSSSSTKHRASMLMQSTAQAVKSSLGPRVEDASSSARHTQQAVVSTVKRGMRKRLASFKVKQAPKIKEKMGALGFEASFNPLFEAGFAKMEDMVFEDPNVENEQIMMPGASSSGTPRKFGTMKKGDKAMEAPVLAGVYAMDSLGNGNSGIRRRSTVPQPQPSSSTVNPRFVSGDDDDDNDNDDDDDDDEVEEVIWLEGTLEGERCWEDIDTGEVVRARPTHGTITNHVTLDAMMSEGGTSSGGGAPTFSAAYLEMRRNFRVTPHDDNDNGGYDAYDNDNDDGYDEVDEALEEIRKPDDSQQQALQSLLRS